MNIIIDDLTLSRMPLGGLLRTVKPPEPESDSVKCAKACDIALKTLQALDDEDRDIDEKKKLSKSSSHHYPYLDQALCGRYRENIENNEYSAKENLYLRCKSNLRNVEKHFGVDLQSSSSSSSPTAKFAPTRTDAEVKAGDEAEVHSISTASAPAAVIISRTINPVQAQAPVDNLQEHSNHTSVSTHSHPHPSSINATKWSRPGIGSSNLTVKNSAIIPEAVVGMAPLTYRKDGSLVRAGVRGQTMLAFDAAGYQDVPLPVPAAPPEPVHATTSSSSSSSVSSKKRPLPTAARASGGRGQQQSITHFVSSAAVASASATISIPTSELAPAGTSCGSGSGSGCFIEVTKTAGCTLRTGIDMDDSQRLCLLPFGTRLQYDYSQQVSGIPAEGVLPTQRYRVLIDKNELSSLQIDNPNSVDPDVWMPSPFFGTQSHSQEGRNGGTNTGMGMEHVQSAPMEGFVYGWVSARGRLTSDNGEICRIYSTATCYVDKEQDQEQEQIRNHGQKQGQGQGEEKGRQKQQNMSDMHIHSASHTHAREVPIDLTFDMDDFRYIAGSSSSNITANASAHRVAAAATPSSSTSAVSAAVASASQSKQICQSYAPSLATPAVISPRPGSGSTVSTAAVSAASVRNRTLWALRAGSVVNRPNLGPR